jgi:flagellar hook-basal body complex protein FliE
MSISSIVDLSSRIGGTGTAATGAAPAAGAESSGSFADALKGLVESTDKSGEQANAAIGGMLDKSVDVHDAMIALQRAEMSLQLTVQIRNKLVQAYQDIMRMPV